MSGAMAAISDCAGSVCPVARARVARSQPTSRSRRGQPLAIHGWCYGLKDGLVKDLGVTMSRADQVVDVFRAAIKRYPRGDAAAAEFGATEPPPDES